MPREIVFVWGVYKIWGFPKIRGTILGVPLIRIIVSWGLYWGPLILGNYHIHIYIYTHTRNYRDYIGIIGVHKEYRVGSGFWIQGLGFRVWG